MCFSNPIILRSIQSKRECAGVTFFVNSCKVDVHPTTLWWWCQILLYPNRNTKPFLRIFLKMLLSVWFLARLSKLFVCWKRKQYCKYFPSENTDKQLIITAAELTTFPPSGFWHWQLTRNSCWWLGQMDFIHWKKIGKWELLRCRFGKAFCKIQCITKTSELNQKWDLSTLSI